MCEVVGSKERGREKRIDDVSSLVNSTVTYIELFKNKDDNTLFTLYLTVLLLFLQGT